MEIGSQEIPHRETFLLIKAFCFVLSSQSGRINCSMERLCVSVDLYQLVYFFFFLPGSNLLTLRKVYCSYSLLTFGYWIEKHHNRQKGMHLPQRPSRGRWAMEPYCRYQPAGTTSNTSPTSYCSFLQWRFSCIQVAVPIIASYCSSGCSLAWNLPGKMKAPIYSSKWSRLATRSLHDVFTLLEYLLSPPPFTFC